MLVIVRVYNQRMNMRSTKLQNVFVVPHTTITLDLKTTVNNEIIAGIFASHDRPWLVALINYR